MIRHGEIAFPWGEGLTTFRLGIGEWRELKAKLKVGPPDLYQRVFAGHWDIDDCPEIIRLGYIGGGGDPLDALRLIEYYCYERAPFASVGPALKIMAAALFEPEETGDSKKNDAAAASEAMASHSALSTATVQ